MKHILKKLWIVICLAILINVPIILMGTIRSDMSVTLKGDLTNVNSLVEIETSNTENGSFSSIYVISFDKSTYLQNIFVKNSLTSKLEPIYDGYQHISDLEAYQMGQVQKSSSVSTAIITAYNYAKKYNNDIDIIFSYKSVMVSYYKVDSPFRIKDEIVEINNISISKNPKEFIDAYNNRKIGDKFKIVRNSKEIEIILDENSIYSFVCYLQYDIDFDKTTPKLKINNTSVGGPSGGLLQTLSIINKLIEYDLSKGLKIAGTGTMSITGKVGEIGGVEQKIYTAFSKNVDVFFCPEENYQDALKAYNTLKNKERMALVMVKTLEDAINYLNNV